MSRVAFGLGANLGDRVAALQGAVDLLVPLLTDAHVSSVYETAPVGGPEQPDYANAVLVGDTDLDARTLLAACHTAERAWHRTREIRWGARTLDVDLLRLDQLVVRDLDLVLPHPRAHERGFVLVPWAEVEPQALIVGHGRVVELAAQAVLRDGPAAVRRRTDVALSVGAR